MTTKKVLVEIKRNEAMCSQCGACIPICPSGALYIKNRRTMEVGFDKEKCTGCEICIEACPFRAMEIES